LFTLAPTLSLGLEVDHARDDTEDAYWGTPLVNKQIDKSLRDVNYNNLDDNIFKSDTTWLRGNLAWQPSAAWELKNTVYSYDSFRDWRNVENYDYNTSTNTVTRSSWGNVDHKHEVVGDRVELLNKGKLGELDNRLLIGSDYNKTQFTTARNGFPTSAETVDPLNPPSRSFNNVPKTLARDVSIDQWSLFLEDQLALTDATKLVAGARYDRFGVNWIYYDQAGAPQEAKTHRTTSYRAGLVHNLTPSLTLYGSYATAVEPGGTLLLLNRNQSQLDLTEATQWETGLKQAFWSGRGEWTLALYDIEKTNVFVPDPANPSNRIQAGKQSSTGGEIAVGLRPSSQWKIDANYAYVRAKFDDFSEGNPPVSRNGNTPPLVPKTVTNLGVRYVPLANWELGAWVRHVAKVYTDNANTTELPAYTTLDLGVNYKQRKDLDFGFRVRNVTDELYATWAYRAQQVTIAEPRTYEVSVSAKF
jgi:iron complex outermembrane receptor protein